MNTLAPVTSAAAIVVGNLDGVHRGHQTVLAQARGIAQAKGLETLVLTFDPHPNEVLRGSTPPRLATVERRIELLERHGADRVFIEAFTPDLAAYPPERFARELLSEKLRARAIVVGANFRFGAHRTGDLDALRGFGKQLGFDVAVTEVACDERGPISSTRVRDAISAGEIAEATRLLGRRHSVSGVVEGGDRRGRTIGFPTANIGGATEVLPPYGVYAVFASSPVLGEDRAGVMNVGVRPTVDGKNLRIEVHLFDFDGDLYGAPMRVHLVERVRGERKFTGLDELKAQIAIDARSAREALGNVSSGDGSQPPRP